MDLHFNQSLASGYHSGSQISRVLTEDWMERNMFCPVCGAPVLGHYEANKPVADFKIINSHYPVYCGSEFWEHLTSDKQFYHRLAKAFGEVVEEDTEASHIVKNMVTNLATEIKDYINTYAYTTKSA